MFLDGLELRNWALADLDTSGMADSTAAAVVLAASWQLPFNSTFAL